MQNRKHFPIRESGVVMGSLVATVVVAFGQAGCVGNPGAHVSFQHTSGAWPEQLLGRELQTTTEHFALYATNKDIGDRLRVSVEEELAAFRSRYAPESTGQGLVFAIEPGEEPCSVIEDWRERNVDRSRLIVWSSPIRSQRVRINTGRPYSLFMHLYFRESFAMSLDDLSAVADLKALPFQPAWICFLTTDKHMIPAFDLEVRRGNQHAKEIRKSVPAIVRLLSAPVQIMSFFVWPLIYPKYRSIDLTLMHLQRREILWQTLLEVTVADESHRFEQLASLRDEIDDAWKYIWFRRPID